MDRWIDGQTDGQTDPLRAPTIRATLQPSVDPSAACSAHATQQANTSYRCPISKLLPPPCAVLLVSSLRHMTSSTVLTRFQMIMRSSVRLYAFKIFSHGIYQSLEKTYS